MKQVFYKGLLALTIAFGFTSCDKNDVDMDIKTQTKEAVSAGISSKVTFSQDGIGIVVPKLKGSESSKTHLEFAHIYSSTPQDLSIVNGAGVEQYTGSYAASDVSTINPASIILENGIGYVATSSNASNDGLGVVSSFLPYTSTVDFDLSVSRSIVLAATLERGFLIVNGEAEAADGNRISGATANGTALLDGGDGDFYGYLLAGEHTIVVSYLHNNEDASVSVVRDVAIGTAYTVELDLLEEAPEPQITTRSEVTTITNNEANIGPESAGRDINGDLDMFDDIERSSTIIYTVTDGELPGVPGEAVLGLWSVTKDYSSVFVDQNGDGVNDADQAGEDAVDTYSYSEWLPATAGAEFATVDQTRVATFNQMGDIDEPAVVAEDIARTIDNTAYVADEADEFVYSAFSGDAPATTFVLGVASVSTSTAASNVEMVVRTTTTTRTSDVAAYEQTRTVSVDVNVREDDPALDLADADSLTQTIDATSVVADPIVLTEQVANPAYVAPSEDVDVSLSQTDFTEDAGALTWTGSGDATGYSILIKSGLSNNTYIYAITGNGFSGANSAEFSGADDDAAYYAAVDAAIAAIEAQINL